MSNADSVETESKKSNFSFTLGKPKRRSYPDEYEETADGSKLPEVVDLVSSEDEEEDTSSSPAAYDENSNSNSNTANNVNGGSVVNGNKYDSEPKGTMSQPTNEVSTSRIGSQYQAETVHLVENLDDRSKVQTKEDLVWAPSDKLTAEEFDEYLHQACYKHSYNIEQALSLLFWHKFDLKKAYHDLNVFVPTPVIWTREEQILFEHAFTFHGKNFSKIRQVLPDKKQADLVNYYYMWKKSRANTSLIDCQQMNKANNGANSDSLDNSLREDNEDGEENFENVTKICLNCDLITNDLQSTPKGMLCNPCYNYWKHTGLMKPDHLTNFTVPSAGEDTSQAVSSTTNGDTKNHLTTNGTEAKPSVDANANANTKVNSQKIFHKSLRKLPKGIYLNCEELLSLAKTDNDQIFDTLGVKLKAKKEEVQRNKQLITDLLLKLTQDNRLEIALDNELLEMEENAEPTPYWSANEIELVLQGFSRYGDNFEFISEVIRTKTEASIKAFYEYNKEFLNLDKFIAPANAKDLKAKANTVIENLSKAAQPNAPKMLAAEISSSSNGHESKPTVKLDPKDNEDVIVIDEDDTRSSSKTSTLKEPCKPAEASEPSKTVKSYVSSIDESEDVIFFSNDSN